MGICRKLANLTNQKVIEIHESDLKELVVFTIINEIIALETSLVEAVVPYQVKNK